MSDDNPSVEVPIASFLREGMPIFDSTGKKIEQVRAYNLTTGYMLVEGGALQQHDYYVPLVAVRTIDRREIYLGTVKDLLALQIRGGARGMVIPECMDPADADEARTVAWHEMPSGYGGSAVEIALVDIAAVARQAHEGMTVLDLLDDYVGEITRLDGVRNLMMVKHAYADPPSLYIPFDAVASVDEDKEVVRLLRARPSWGGLRRTADVPRNAC